MGLISGFRVECLSPLPSPPPAFGGVDLVSRSRHRHRRGQCKPSILFLVLTIATGGVDLVAQGEKTGGSFGIVISSLFLFPLPSSLTVFIEEFPSPSRTWKGKEKKADSQAEATKAESSKLRKDLIEAMGKANDAKTKLKEVSDELRTEKMLIIQNDEEIQSAILKLNSECEKALAEFLSSKTYSIATFDEYFKGFELLQQWTMKHHTEFNYSNIEFKAIDKEIMVDEAIEQARANEQAGVEGGEEG
nr:hypothetical protein CFP56_42811 [Quercus suber]